MGKISDELRGKLEADPQDWTAIVDAIAALEDERDAMLRNSMNQLGP